MSCDVKNERDAALRRALKGSIPSRGKISKPVEVARPK